jgi:tetratricopeptide (TPR) repeat protein
MNMKFMRIIAGMLILSAVFGAVTKAQERNDVIAVYNEGAKAVQSDLSTAIEAFEKVVVMSEKVGESVDDLKAKAVQVLPSLYFKAAYSSLNEKKPATEIIQAAKKATAAAEKYGSESNKANSDKILVQGYYTLGTEYFNDKDYENALLAFDSLLAVNPDYVTAIYNKALIYRAQENSEAFEQTVDLFLQKLGTGTEDERAAQASSLALEYFRAAGSQANQAGNLDEALAFLTKAAKYGDDKDLFYYFSDVYNKQENFNNAAEYAQKGLDLETGDAEAKAKFYFQLALAQKGKGQTADACTSFKNALFGAFAEAAKAERTNLKCQ